MKNGALSSRLGVLVGASLMAGVCLADDGPRYTFAEIGYSHTEIDDFDADGEMIGISGSIALTDMVHMFASFDDGELDGDGGNDPDITTTMVGAGVNYAISPTMDLVGQVAWVMYEIDAGAFDADEDGIALAGGIRAMVSPQFELNGGITYVDVDDSDETSLVVGAVYSFTDMVAGTADVSFGDDTTTYGIGLRIYFN